MEKRPTTTSRIRFQDCDPLGHLNNGRYIDYLINAREDHLIKYYDFDTYDYLDRNRIGWVVGKSEILYRNPALLNELVTIQSMVYKFDERKIDVELTMYDESKTHLKAIMRSLFIPFDVMSNSVSKNDQTVMELLEAVVVDTGNMSIEERAEAIKSELG